MGSRAFGHRRAAVALLALAIAACAEADVEASTTSTAVIPSTTSSVGTTTTFPNATTTTETTTTTDTGQNILVFFASADQSDCSNTETFERGVYEQVGPFASAFGILTAGPTDEEKASGAGSFFSADTGGMIRSVSFENGLLTVDFEDLRPVIPNASTSCGSISLIAQLNGTAFQFEEVDRVTYQINGSCEAFFNWLQRDCQEYPRP